MAPLRRKSTYPKLTFVFPKSLYKDSEGKALVFAVAGAGKTMHTSTQVYIRG